MQVARVVEPFPPHVHESGTDPVPDGCVEVRTFDFMVSDGFVMVYGDGFLQFGTYPGWARAA
eukprot:2160356-Karenia_brevis.AAC.1